MKLRAPCMLGNATVLERTSIPKQSTNASSPSQQIENDEKEEYKSSYT